VRAVVLTGTGGELEVAEVDDPVPGPAEVVVAVRACGICGSDVHIATVVGTAGTIMGHEIAGVVEERGSGVHEGWTPGTAVTARPFSSCGICGSCRSGRADHCRQFHLRGATRPGGFAERTVLSAEELYVLPASLTGPDQALAEPLAVARHVLRRVELRAGERLAVLGAGPIGLAVTAWARALGAGSVVVSDPNARRRELAVALGADAVIDPTAEDIGPACRRALGGRPPIVLECTGKVGLIDQAMTLADTEGRIGVVGACMSSDAFLPFTALRKELDVRFAVYYDRQDFVDTLRGLDDGSLVVEGLVTDVIGLDALPDVFAQMLAGAGTGKVVVVP
jgi:(R,R)-butanediol dehydrogenase / meso-butanediol dehydrogenase / diacetyl reductase